MTPGPSSTSFPGAPESSFGSSSSSASVLRGQSPHQTRSIRIASDIEPLDLKHCFHCGQQLETLVTRAPSPTSDRIITIGSHAFVVPVQHRQAAPDQPMTLSRQSDPVSGENWMDEEGRPLCQTCAHQGPPASVEIETGLSTLEADDTVTSSAPASPSVSNGHNGASAWRSHLIFEGSTDAGPSSRSDTPRSFDSRMRATAAAFHPNLSESTPLSISIERRRGSYDRNSPRASPSALPHNLRSSAPSRRTSPVRWRNTEDRGSTSFDRSRKWSQSPPHLLNLQDGGSPSQPIVRVPNRAGNDVVAADDSDSDGESRWGPSAMTRLRLSTAEAPRLSTSGMKRAHTESILPSSDQAERLPAISWHDPRRPDPMQDVSRLRMPARGRGCLFPGAIFKGTQKSGRLSYDVSVEILNVDLNNSHLDGYLNIRGLTEDWPELTTFFTAEIIGRQSGFITGRWGATEQDDLKHWGRFAPFKSLSKTLKKPDMRFNHLNKQYVFMRWKEHFLVPDWRVRDIIGASFAGFYYVCAEWGDLADWTPGSIEPSASRLAGSNLGQYHSALGQARSNVVIHEHSPTSSPRARTPLSRRRLGQPINHGAETTAPSQTPNTSVAALLASQSAADAEWRLQLAIRDGTPLSSQDRRMLHALGIPITVQVGTPQPHLSRAPPAGSPLLGEELSARQRLLDMMDRSLARPSQLNGSTSTASGPRTRDLALASSASASSSADSSYRISTRSGAGFSGSGADASATDVDMSGPDDAQLKKAAEDENGLPSGRITAFYYHENSEPYQRLDLNHVQRATCEAFEMR